MPTESKKSNRKLIVNSAQDNDTPQSVDILANQHITLNADSLGLQESDKPLTKRIDHSDGRQYLVAPTVAIVQGVMNDILYLEEEIMAYPDAWNGRPLVISHPQNDNGDFVTANSPEVFSTSPGYYFNADFRNNALTGEWWIDIAKAEKIEGPAANLVNWLEAGILLEQSTGLFADIEAQTGVYNDVPYSGIARNIRPDHVAILLDEEGACSIRDGCGTPRIKVNEEGGEANEEDTIVIDLGSPLSKLNGLTLDKIKQAFSDTLKSLMNMRVEDGDEPVESPESNPPETPTTNDNEESITNMEREELIEQILALELPYTRAMLDIATDEDLTAIWAKFGPMAEENGMEEEPEDNEAETPVTEEIPTPAMALQVPPEVTQVAGMIQELGGVEAIKSVIDESRQRASMEADELTQAIMANTNMTAEDLEGQSLPFLRKLAKNSQVNQPNFMANGVGFNTPAQQGQEDFDYGWKAEAQ